MVEFVNDRLGLIPQGDEVINIVIFIKVPLDFDRDPVIVAVDSLAFLAVKRDEMSRREDEKILGHPDVILRRDRHGMGS